MRNSISELIYSFKGQFRSSYLADCRNYLYRRGQRIERARESFHFPPQASKQFLFEIVPKQWEIQNISRSTTTKVPTAKPIQLQSLIKLSADSEQHPWSNENENEYEKSRSSCQIYETNNSSLHVLSYSSELAYSMRMKRNIFRSNQITTRNQNKNKIRNNQNQAHRNNDGQQRHQNRWRIL